ncbi:type II secretion system protein [Persicirhabdus sediminis]|uniref:Type II secretion system protein n=1 Tax=Persicirhabdus sediminis TaxID=454144 RepID=A0A8J7MAT4_9BACT|nr:type II secretion system protein [Persicirhabdus sediminis]MBK1790104.1 type II secretion system protein [Persicirhabdus sediminis]
MKLNTNKAVLKPGMTLIELTIVILVLITLISVLFIGAKAYKEGADNATCILNQEQVQKAVRSHQNMNAKNDTESFPHDEVFGATGIISEPTEPTEPDNLYAGMQDDVYPVVGTAYISCTTTNGNGPHAPASTEGW